MWPHCSCGGSACTDQDSAGSNACHDGTISASHSPPLLEDRRSFNDIGDIVVSPLADVTVTVATFPDVPVVEQSRWQPLPRSLRLCRQQCCAEKLAARDALRRSLNAQRQRIRRLDEAYRVAERARNAQRQRRLRANAEYRARELYRNRLRRRQKNALRYGAQYGSIEDLAWLRDCFSEEEWSSLESLWATPTRGVGRGRNGTGVRENNMTTWAEAVEAATRSLSLASTENLYKSGWLRAPLIVGPPPPDDEPRSLLLLSVPNVALSAPSTVTLEDLLTGALPLRFSPDCGMEPVTSDEELLK